MTFVSNATMIGAAALCFGGSIRSRRPLAVAAALIMLVSMIDLVAFETLPPLTWTGLLAFGGMMLGFDLRRRERADRDHAAGSPPDALHRSTMLAAALAYPATAWLVATHGHHRAAVPTTSPTKHTHGGAGDLSVLPVFAGWVLVMVLAVLAVVAVRRRRGWPAAESGGMLVMLTAMLVGE